MCSMRNSLRKFTITSTTTVRCENDEDKDDNDDDRSDDNRKDPQHAHDVESTLNQC
jgi:hypothetical protein